MRPRWHRSESDHAPAAHDDVRRPDRARRRAGGALRRARAGARRRPRCRGARAVGQRSGADGRRRPPPHPRCGGCRRSRQARTRRSRRGSPTTSSSPPDAGCTTGRSPSTPSRWCWRRPDGCRTCVRAQAEHRWAGELGGMQDARPGHEFRTLDGAHVLIWGFGSIAARLAPLLSALGAAGHGRRDRRRRPARLPGDLGVRPAGPPAAHRRADLVAARHRADPARGRRRRPGPAARARMGGQRGPRCDARRGRAARRAPVGPAGGRRTRRVRDRTPPGRLPALGRAAGADQPARRGRAARGAPASWWPRTSRRSCPGASSATSSRARTDLGADAAGTAGSCRTSGS